MTIGIYCIENIINNKKYIGQSSNIEKRLNYHKTKLNNNKHYNPHIQNAWNKYGKENFKFWIIEKCSIKNLNEKEFFYIIFYNSKNNGYNMSDGGNGGGLNPSPETKLKMSKASTGRPSGFKGKHQSEEAKKKMSESHKGKSLSEEHKMKISKSSRKQPLSEEHKKKISNSKIGLPQSNEKRKKVSESQKKLWSSDGYRKKCRMLIKK